MKESAKRAYAKYREKTSRINITFGINEQQIYKFICKQDNKSKYIKDLIRADMATKEEPR